MNTNLLDFTLTDKISCGACENNDNVYFTTCKTIFCSFNDHLCENCFDFCQHSCSDTEYSNVLLKKHEIKECNVCLEEKQIQIKCKVCKFYYCNDCFVIYKYKFHNSLCPMCKH